MPIAAMEGGADSFLLKLYFNKLHRETADIKQYSGDEHSLPTLADIFDDLLAVLKQTNNIGRGGGAEHSESIEGALIESHVSRLRLRTRQLLIGRVLPLVEQLLGERMLALDEIFKTYNEGELLTTAEESLKEILRIAQCLSSHEEEDFEDGLTWTKCLFICK
jgi:hypothetical protein